MDHFKDIHSIVSNHYDLQEMTQIKPISIGLIHQTFILSVKDQPKYVLQGLHPKLSSEAILEDYEAVTLHLEKHCYNGPRLIKTNEGLRAALDHQDHKWRLSTFVPGNTYEEVQSNDLAEIGGQSLAHFHKIMNQMTYEFKSTHPGHDTPGHLQNLVTTSQVTKYQTLWSKIAPFGENIIEQLSGVLLPKTLPQQVVHGDPKISNLRFLKNHAIMIDLDTCNRHTRLVDLGDAVRSWCHQPQAPLGQRFSLPIWKALIQGYLSKASPLTQQEKDRLPQAGYLITLELASRFARDYLEDHYFGYDAQRFPSRRAHNFYRIKAMLQLAHEMKSKEEEMHEFIGKII